MREADREKREAEAKIEQERREAHEAEAQIEWEKLELMEKFSPKSAKLTRKHVRLRHELCMKNARH